MRQSQDKTLIQIAALLDRYGFELNGLTIFQLIEDWSAIYSVYWIRLAIVEALYQGRYKVISIEHILSLWKRRGQPTYHFTHDFERLICENLIVDNSTETLPEVDNFSNSDSNHDPIAESTKSSSQPITLTPVKELVKKITASPITFPEKLSTNGKKNHPSVDTAVNNLDEPKATPTNGDRSIHQFIPHRDPSEFYDKLRAVAHQELAENTKDTEFSGTQSSSQP